MKAQIHRGCSIWWEMSGGVLHFGACCADSSRCRWQLSCLVGAVDFLWLGALFPRAAVGNLVLGGSCWLFMACALFLALRWQLSCMVGAVDFFMLALYFLALPLAALVHGGSCWLLWLGALFLALPLAALVHGGSYWLFYGAGFACFGGFSPPCPLARETRLSDSRLRSAPFFKHPTPIPTMPDHIAPA